MGLIVAVLVMIVVTLLVDEQRTYLNRPQASAVDVLRLTAMLGIFAVGSAIVIIAGGIDLSSGSVIAFSGTVCASIMLFLAPEAMQSPRPPEVPVWVISVAIAGTVAVGVLIGTLHAWLISVVGLPPFVATLASLVGLRSLARAIIPNVTTTVTGSGSDQIFLFDDGFRYLATSVWIPVVVFLAVSVLAWFLLSRTVVGRHIYALGGNEQAARLSGIRTDRVKWLAYCLSAVASSIAGILYIGEQGSANPQVLGMGYELNAIAAAVVGGCSLQGGIGTIPGVMLGCLFLRVVIDGIAKMITTGADVYEGLIVGILVVVAVAFNRLRESRAGRKRFFPGVLGGMAILTLCLLAGVLTTLMAGRSYGAVAAVVALVALSAVKAYESRQPSTAVG